MRDDFGGHLITLAYRDGKTVAVDVSPRMRPAVERWLDRGLIEWVGPRGDELQRVTMPSDPEFLPRLRDYLGLYQLPCEVTP